MKYQGNERILFVDDEKSMVSVGRYRLERLGYPLNCDYGGSWTPNGRKMNLTENCSVVHWFSGI